MSAEFARGATAPSASAGSTPIHNTTASSTGSPQSEQQQQTHVPHIRIVPHIVDVRKDLYFEVMDRDVSESTLLKVGRFTEKVSQQMSRIAFKSKVVSRSHAEIWTEGGQFYIRDTKSSSGTFLNHMRLSPPGVESRPHPLHDGDILQLGVDYQGGNQDIYKCVKIRLEINRTWQRSKENPFRRQVMANIQNAYHANAPAGGASDNNNECCICLYQMIAFQALFLAPCSHCFHYKCVKPILFTSTGFNCPLCRTYADLEASVTIDENEMDVDVRPPALPPSVQQHQQHQPGAEQSSSMAAAAAADAEAAVRAAEAGAPAASAAPRSIGGHDDGPADLAQTSADAVSADRDDANATPVPTNEPNVDSFGTTPVGSMPTSLGPLGSPNAANGGDADASLVGSGAAGHQQIQHGEADADDAIQMVSSPALPSGNPAGAAAAADVCNQRNPVAHPSPQANANRAAPNSSEV
ncbi:hypothetical protein H4R20_000461 [Coemansia guatemalensis]|uniref:SMAD/FHA domain-containing protein n=1 Tax=Coemansia guatemalensis TaxID=2761395 RepID=A0A9W8I656_9FUNG|nr:hypothetical protein H4R20_000461 [Coemansia guatemalensis]